MGYIRVYVGYKILSEHHIHAHVCVCVSVCVRERGREQDESSFSKN